MLNLDDPIYLDNNATTRCDPAVVAAMLPYFSEWYGNAATGLHPLGRKAARAIEIAREQTAVLLNARPEEIIFTSGATESNNLAILGLGRRAVGGQRKRIVTTAVEHKAVLEPCHVLSSLGYEIIVLPIDTAGRVDVELPNRRLPGLPQMAQRPQGAHPKRRRHLALHQNRHRPPRNHPPHSRN